MTEAFSMGLESISRRTVTSMWEVGGGGLYLRPRWAESCAERLIPETATRATAMVRERKEEQDNMPALYPLACTPSEGREVENCATGWEIGYGLSSLSSAAG